MNHRELEDFACSFFAAVDVQCAEGLRPFLTDDVLLRMANMPATIGIEPLIEAFKASEAHFTSVEHIIQGIWTGLWEEGPVVSIEAVVRYGFADGRKIELPANSTLRLTQENKIADYRIFMDPGPAFS
ncbi:nuclear transport factor 2 family protein [Vibrio sp. JC009]|uniref:nuclear transport factor 2 family protein n=1 Tax=Vibrio sp. JC009 TaxID=2912314 RepID=UPI0023B15AE5|nr:nuclear transport factor 2 family protein [Vibrio sp. JC009]WED23021.1 nuclear transport factor 2 family protein [Vibrio sp. JC009]